MSLKDVNPVNVRKPKRIAIVIANPAVSTTTGWSVGFWWSELTHPYYAFVEKGYAVDIFWPDGGKCAPDQLSDPRDPSGYSSSDLISMGFLSTPKLAALIEETKSVRVLKPDDFDAIVVAGGPAPMFTFDKAEHLHKAFVALESFCLVRRHPRRKPLCDDGAPMRVSHRRMWKRGTGGAVSTAE
jgi:hypothetical protein